MDQERNQGNESEADGHLLASFARLYQAARGADAETEDYVAKHLAVVARGFERGHMIRPPEWTAAMTSRDYLLRCGLSEERIEGLLATVDAVAPTAEAATAAGPKPHRLP